MAHYITRKLQRLGWSYSGIQQWGYCWLIMVLEVCATLQGYAKPITDPPWSWCEQYDIPKRVSKAFNVCESALIICKVDGASVTNPGEWKIDTHGAGGCAQVSLEDLMLSISRSLDVAKCWSLCLPTFSYSSWIEPATLLSQAQGSNQ